MCLVLDYISLTTGRIEPPGKCVGGGGIQILHKYRAQISEGYAGSCTCPEEVSHQQRA